MDHSEVKHLPQIDHAPAKIEKLSEAIRIGHFMIPETRQSYLQDGCACALGAAAYAMGYRDQSGEGNDLVPHVIPTMFKDVSLRLVREISNLHYNGKMNRLEIADWLEGRGL